jgi:hypothetical protein
MATIQLRLLKLGARVQECKDRIKISLPSSCPAAPVLRCSLMLLTCVRLTSQALCSSVESDDDAGAKS